MSASPAIPAEPLVRHQRDARGVHRLTLNQPKSFNVLSEAMLAELQRLLDQIGADPAARAVVIGAEGKAFCAGHDLKQMKASPRLDYYQALFAQCSRMMLSILRLPVPVLARVQGLATAAGCQLVAQCDLAVAAQGAMTLAPLRSSTEQHSWLVSTMAVSVIIGASILIVQGPFAVTTPYPFPGIRILGVRTPFAYLAVMALLVLCFVALQLFLRHTRTGVAISALAQDLELARATGLRVRLLQVVSFGISGAILGVTGFVAAPIISIAPDSGISYILSGFIAAVIGGMGNLYGALVGGPIVGVVAMSSAYLFGGEFQNLILLTLLVAVLMVRPQGLFGRMSTRHV